MSIITLETEELSVEFDAENPLRLKRITHRASGREIALDTQQRFMVRMPKRLSDPYFLVNVDSVDVSDGAVSFELSDDEKLFKLSCRMASTGDGITWTAKVEAGEPLWMLEWQIDAIDLHQVVVPALGGQALDARMPTGMSMAYKYPFWWQSQFAIGEMAREGEGGVWLRTKDVDPRMKVLRIRKGDDAFALGLGLEADGPLESTTLEVEWHLDGYQGSWKRPADVHRAWMQDAFGTVPYEEHPHFPDWAGDINFILEMWGMSKETPEPWHTFDEMAERLHAFAEHHDPKQTLVYLPGFAEEGIDSNAPSYQPAAKCGGRERFKHLVDTAHDLGYRVMIHTNVLALAYCHPKFEEFKDFQVVDCFGRSMGWGNDMDGDWLAEPYFAYMNPGHEEWADHMTGVFEDLVESFGLDGIFLDQTLLAFNVGRGPNFMRGMRKHVRRLQKAFPNVLFAGEGLHEQVLSALPMAQIHGIDSIAGVHGMEGALEWRKVHPVSAYLFSPFTRLTAHLLTKHPSSPTFDRQEEAYDELGVIPALVLYDRKQRIDVPQLKSMLERAQALSHPSERTGSSS